MTRVGAGVAQWLHRYGIALTAAVLVVAGTANAFSYPSGSLALAVALSAVTGAAVLARQRSVWLLAVVVSAGLAGLAAVGIGETPMWAFVELLLVAFWLAEGLPRREAVVAVGLLFVAAVAFDARSGESSIAGSIVSPAVIVGGPALAGALLRRSREQAARLASLSAELAEQRDQAALAGQLAERARIAREIHDVIAHTVSVMLVQAGAAEDMLDPGHPASAPVAAIRATGKQALTDLRRVIGVLRDDSSSGVRPQPTLAELPDLVAETCATGAQVTLDMGEATDERLPPGAQLTIYRTVQEALTNARKHAPGAAVTVVVKTDRQGTHVRVDDDGPSREATTSPGFGLLGLRERAELYGGELSAGPRADGSGWSVRLDLPSQVSGQVPQPSVR